MPSLVHAFRRHAGLSDKRADNLSYGRLWPLVPVSEGCFQRVERAQADLSPCFEDEESRYLSNDRSQLPVDDYTECEYQSVFLTTAPGKSRPQPFTSRYARTAQSDFHQGH